MTIHNFIDHDELAHMLDLTSQEGFSQDIEQMNEMYRLPINYAPTLDNLTKPNGEQETAYQRQIGFLKTLSDEITEGQDIKLKFSIIQQVEDGRTREDLGTIDNKDLAEFADLAFSDLEEAKRQALVSQADWLADITVYCRSEALKYGIALEVINQVVMGSNFTKLPDDGVPIHDANGKFLKDAKNYRPPEDAIYTVMFDESLESEDDDEDADEDDLEVEIDEDGDIEGSGDEE